VSLKPLLDGDIYILIKFKGPKLKLGGYICILVRVENTIIPHSLSDSP